jgi:hypothetical protein
MTNLFASMESSDRQALLRRAEGIAEKNERECREKGYHLSVIGDRCVHCYQHLKYDLKREEEMKARDHTSAVLRFTGKLENGMIK